MPRPLNRTQRYIPGLDGLRAVAVAAVVAYHLGLGWAPGGLLGVGVFFTLSGYLITDLLLGSREATGRLQLRTFWLRRARRLLPALFVMLAAVSVWAAVADPSQLPALRGDAVAAALYVSNWWLIFQHVSYFARFGPPTPLGHLWSLAVEEQFYLVWPWLLAVGLLWVVRVRRRPAPPEPVPPAAGRADLRALGQLQSGQALRGKESPAGVATGSGLAAAFGVGPRRRPLVPLAIATLVLAAASTLEMALLYHPSFDPSRVYDGTDTRAFALLIGAALAMVWPSADLSSRIAARPRVVLDAVGAAGLVSIVVLVWRTDQYSPFLYRGGMLLLSIATAAVVAVVAHPAGRVGRVLGCKPVRWVGVRSYGIYLWHYPVIVLTTPAGVSGTDVPRDLAQVVAIVVLAELSWRFVETPVRQGAIGRAWARVLAAPRLTAALTGRNWAVFGAAAAALVLACAGLGGALPAAPVASAGGSAAGVRVGASSTTVAPAHRGRPRPAAPQTVPTTTTTTSATALPVDVASLRTSCQEVVHIGDSTSESLVSADYLPDPEQRLPAQYTRVGVARSIMRIQGGTSIVETIDDQPNAYQVARTLVRQGYRGCWVLALGTNDAADVYVGSNVGLRQRIQRMMSVIGDQPVLWVNTKTLVSSGPYSETSMRQWDSTLDAACSSYRNMAVFNWAGLAQPSWYIDDGIHYNSDGSAKRAAAIADALATAFPVRGRDASGRRCVVDGSTGWDLPDFRY